MRGRSASLFFLAAVLIASASFSKCSRSGSEYKVVLTDAFQLKHGSQVQYAGVPVGKVEAISLRSSGSGATNQVVVDHDAGTRTKPAVSINGANRYLVTYTANDQGDLNIRRRLGTLA